MDGELVELGGVDEADPELRRRVAVYLADQQAITIRYHQARTIDEKNAALQDLLGHADTHSHLIDEVIKYQADHGNFAKPPAIAAVTNDDKRAEFETATAFYNFRRTVDEHNLLHEFLALGPVKIHFSCFRAWTTSAPATTAATKTTAATTRTSLAT